jgi:hypothetical protein
MNYLAQRIIAVIFGAIGVWSLITGVSSIISSLIRGASWTSAFFASGTALFFGAVFFFVGASGYRRFSRFATLTYEWYAHQYPDSITNNGVRCFACKSAHIRVRGLMNHSYTREHFCAQCGATLYYSPESAGHSR